jgi:hypothetical protein
VEDIAFLSNMRYYLAVRMGRGAWGMGRGAWGMGHGAWGMGHGAWGMGHRAWGKQGIPHHAIEPLYKIMLWLRSQT